MGKKAKAMTKEEKKENAKNQRKLHYAKNAPELRAARAQGERILWIYYR